MKFTKKLLALALTCATIVAFVGCQDPSKEPTTGGGTSLYPENAKLLQLREKTGDSDFTDKDSVALGDFAVPFASVSEADFADAKAGDKIYFTVECQTDGQFRVQNWSWADIVTEIYDAKTDEKIPGTEVDEQLNYTEKSGTFYIILTDDSVTKLKESLEFHGQKATISKIYFAAK